MKRFGQNLYKKVGLKVYVIVHVAVSVADDATVIMAVDALSDG